MNIPFVDLKSQYLNIKTEIDDAIKNVIEETAFIGGKYVNSFEKQFAELYGVKHVISCANGTDSLYVLLKMLGIGIGDEVITVANSWISSSETITQAGAKPIFVDIDPDYYSINESLLQKSVTDKTKAIILVHLHGQMNDMDYLQAFCKNHNIQLIEDCAQSHFSEFKGQLAGTFGIAGSFSFYPGKNLGAYGDAGCIITNDDELARKCKLFARHGALTKHKHEIEGINSRMDGIQAAILSAKLPHILNWTRQRVKNAALYTQLLSQLSEFVTTPKIRPNSKHSFHLYVIRASKRNDLAKFLKENGIETAIHYPTALPNLPCYDYLGLNGSQFPVATNYQDYIISLPMYPELTNENIEYIVNKITEFYPPQ
jgi:dTDP-4-amino-4,6-dideoxygalactose transaminase